MSTINIYAHMLMVNTYLAGARRISFASTPRIRYDGYVNGELRAVVVGKSNALNL